MAEAARHVVITGASRGLGAAMVAEFIQLGHTVSGCARNGAAMQAMSDAYDSPNCFVECDVSSKESVESWSRSVLEGNGPPDLLINNAAIINRNAPLWELSTDEFDSIVDINIKGVFYAIHCFLPAMIERSRGVIINFSSGWGRSPSSEVASYCGTKFAIEGLTQSLALDLPKGLAAIPLSPGVVHTEMLESCFAGSASSYPSPQDWARSAVPYILGLGPRDNGLSTTTP